MTVRDYILIFWLLPLFGSSQNYQYTKPEEMPNGWETAHMNGYTNDTSLVYRLFNELENEHHEMRSLLVIKDDKLILEKYFGANDLATRQDLRSVTKSIRSLLLGIALDQGFIKHLDEPIFKYLEQSVRKNAHPDKNNITIRDLVTMASGLDCNDWDPKSKGQEDRVYKKKDWIQYTLDLPLIKTPGSVSHYCSMGVVLVAQIIGNASGMTIQAFADQYLFGPLGISATWGHTSNKEVLPSAKRLYITPRDLAKIGALMLNKGVWEGRQIVSSEWLNQSTSPQTKIANLDYGFLWWQIPFLVEGTKIPTIAATGNGGQYLFVIPSNNMIVVCTGGAYNSEKDKVPFAIMRDILLPTFASR